ncbi:MAG TPA: DUF5677 domain-containing protein [Terracidiphilus sp.]|jgi:hypothetical protein
MTSFEIDGLFFPEIELFKQAVRTTPPFSTWFDYALGLNRIGFDLMKRATVALADRRLFTLYGHFVRVSQTFQGAVLLAERGMVPNARILLRSGAESAIAICALAKNDKLIDQMVAAHHLMQRKYARLVVNSSEYRAHYTEQEIAEMQVTIASVDALEASSGKKLKDINWADVAAEHCFDLYNLLYRMLSSDGTHATVNSLNRLLEVDSNGQIRAFKVAPDQDGLVEVLSAACLLFIWAAGPFAAAFDRPDTTSELSKQLKLFAELPGAFPRAAAP